MSNFPKTVLGPDFCDVDKFGRQILQYLSFVELTGDDLTELGRNHAWVAVFFTRDVDADRSWSTTQSLVLYGVIFHDNMLIR